MKQRFGFISAAVGITASVFAAAQEKPNIIFVLADDMGIGDVGCYGQDRISTPNIDRLAQDGLRFTSHYAGSTVSAPSRCALLTGKHTGHGFVRGNKSVKTDDGYFDLALPSDETTVAGILKDNGYATVCVGKWGLGGPGTSGSPLNQGFDYFYGYLSQGAAHRYYPEYLYENEEKDMLNGEVYSHFAIMEKGLDFIRKNKEKPIFAYFAITPPHADLDYPDISQYEDSFEETPFINDSGKGYKTQLKPRATYAAMVSEVDRNVGQVVDLLDSLGILDNSIVIFSSDNGVHNVGGHDPKYFNSNGGFRGYKRDLYEGGIRTPLVIRWPGHVEPGTTTDHISAFWDFLPTVCEITGAEIPSGIDGISYLPVLEGNPGKQKKHDYLYYEFFEKGGKQCLIKDGWKLIRLDINNKDKMREELYNLTKDPSEKKNVIAKNSRKAAELRSIMDSERTKSKYFNFKKK